jgi:transcriptional regulator with XRE-family HTH domain
VASRWNPIHEASRRARRAADEFGREVRLGRIGAGRTQAQVAGLMGCSRSRVSRTENGQLASLTIGAAFRHAAAVGLGVSLRVFPGAPRVLDRPQLALLDRLRQRVAPAWHWELEVPMPLRGDFRAADARLTRPACAIVVEAITRLADVQAQVRAAQRKRRDLGADRLILLIGGTRANRLALRNAGPILDEAFPLDGRSALRSLAAGACLPSDTIILL